MANGVDVTFAGAASAIFKGVQVKLADRGLWVKDEDETWSFYPWHRISKVSGFRFAGALGSN
jgi:hypothetical protein